MKPKRTEAAFNDGTRLAALAEISQALAEAGPDSRAVLSTLAQLTSEVLGDACAIIRLNEEGRQLEPIVIYHTDPEAVDLLRRIYAAANSRHVSTLSSQALQTGKAVRQAEVSQEAIRRLLPPDDWPLLEKHSIYSLLVVPLRARSRLVGTLAVGRDRPGRPYSEQDEAFLLALAARAALAIVDADLYEQLRTSNERLSQQEASLRAEIAERRRVEAQLVYQARLLENVTDAVYAIDADNCITAWNRAAEEMFLLPSEAVMGKRLAEVLAGELIDPTAEQAEEMMRRGGRYRGIIRYDRRDGISITTETTGMALRDEAGALIGYISANRDITEQRRAEAQKEAAVDALRRSESELRHNEALLRTVLESMPVGVWIADRNGRILLENPAGRRIWGGSRIGRGSVQVPVRGWWAGSGRPIEPHEWGIPRAVRGEAALNEEIEVETLDGQRKQLLVSAVPLSTADAEIIGALAINEDITDRKLAEMVLWRQAKRLQTVHDIDRAVLAAQSPRDIAQVVVAHLHQMIRCDLVTVLLFDSERQDVEHLAVAPLNGAPYSAGNHVPLEDFGFSAPSDLLVQRQLVDLQAAGDLPSALKRMSQAGLRSLIAVPLATNGHTIGSLILLASQPAAFGADDVETARQVADSLAVALQNAALFAQVERDRQHQQALARRLVEVQENERHAIARELHDEAGQALTSLMLGLGMVERNAGDAQSVVRRARELKESAANVLEGLHQLVMNLRPASLDRVGLVPALQQHAEWFREQHGTHVDLLTLGFDQEGEGDGGARRLPPDVEIALFRIVQEALTNVARHAQARHVGIIIERQDDRITAVIEDDGVGFDLEVALARGRLGVFGMRERAEMLGGSLTVESTPGAGTTLFVDLPVSADAETQQEAPNGEQEDGD